MRHTITITMAALCALSVSVTQAQVLAPAIGREGVLPFDFVTRIAQAESLEETEEILKELEKETTGTALVPQLTIDVAPRAFFT